MWGVQYAKTSFGIVGSGACSDHTFFIQFITLRCSTGTIGQSHYVFPEE